MKKNINEKRIKRKIKKFFDDKRKIFFKKKYERNNLKFHMMKFDKV